jgi:hypothetical protein
MLDPNPEQTARIHSITCGNCRSYSWSRDTMQPRQSPNGAWHHPNCGTAFPEHERRHPGDVSDARSSITCSNCRNYCWDPGIMQPRQSPNGAWHHPSCATAFPELRRQPGDVGAARR